MKDLSIIIVNFNTKDFVIACIRSIISNYSNEISSQEFEIIVVDNNSIDDSAHSLEKIKEITLIRNSQNVGFSKANNIAIKKSSGRYVLFLNPDTIVNKDTLPKLIEFMDEHPQAGAASCKVLLPNGKIDEASHRGFPTPWRTFTHFSGIWRFFRKSNFWNGYYQGFENLNKTHKVDVIAGAFMFVRREAGESVGWWDEDYFFYGEDIEFCWDLNEKGWDVYYYPDVSVLHFKGVSAGIKKISKEITTADKETRKIATIHRFNAMTIFYNKNLKDNYPFFINFLVFAAINIKLKLRLIKL